MAQSSSSSSVKSSLESIREWVVDHKLRAVGGFWASGVIGSLAYNWTQPGKASVKIIHARLHAQALTLAALVGAAAVEYYDHRNNNNINGGGKTTDRYPKFLHLDHNASNYSQKD